MFRTALSLVAVTALLVSAPLAAQTAAPGSTASKPARSSSRSKPALTSPININTANAGDLDGLPGIGAKTAARIVEYRQKNGPFKKVEELMNVRGIGEKNFLRLKAQLTISAKAGESAAAQ